MFGTPNPPSLREIYSSTAKTMDKSQETLAEIHSSSSETLDKSQDTPSVTLISAKKVALSTPPEGNTMLAMFNRVFKCLESIQKDIRVMEAEQIKIQSQLSEMCSKEGAYAEFHVTNWYFNSKTDIELLQLNFNLRREKPLTAALARYFFGVSFGKTMSAFILCISKKVLSKSVALQYSRLGRKGKKRFELVEEVYNAILTAAALKFKEAGREEPAEKFGLVLASACDWEGSRVNKKISECAEDIDKLC